MLEVTDDAICMAIALRNLGTGLAALYARCVQVGSQMPLSHPRLEEFTGQIRDLLPGGRRHRILAERSPRSGGRRLQGSGYGDRDQETADGKRALR